MAIAAWFLITVLNSGQPGDVRGFPSKHLCEEAKSAAQYGVTLEERDSVEKQTEWREAFLDSAFKVEHPPRTPKTKSEKNRMAQEKLAATRMEKSGIGWIGGGGGCWYSSDGTQSEYSEEYNPKTGMIETQQCGPLHKPFEVSNIKFAECVKK